MHRPSARGTQGLWVAWASSKGAPWQLNPCLHQLCWLVRKVSWFEWGGNITHRVWSTELASFMSILSRSFLLLILWWGMLVRTVCWAYEKRNILDALALPVGCCRCQSVYPNSLNCRILLQHSEQSRGFPLYVRPPNYKTYSQPPAETGKVWDWGSLWVQF